MHIHIIYIYIQYASRNPAALKHNIKPLFQFWGADLKIFSKFGVSWITFLLHFGVHLRVRNGLGTKMAPESIQLRKGTTPGVECYFFGALLVHFGEDVVPKCVFVSVCLASVVLHRKCLDYWTPTTPIICLQR